VLEGGARVFASQHVLQRRRPREGIGLLLGGRRGDALGHVHVSQVSPVNRASGRHLSRSPGPRSGDPRATTAATTPIAGLPRRLRGRRLREVRGDIGLLGVVLVLRAALSLPRREALSCRCPRLRARFLLDRRRRAVHAPRAGRVEMGPCAIHHRHVLDPPGQCHCRARPVPSCGLIRARAHDRLERFEPRHRLLDARSGPGPCPPPPPRPTCSNIGQVGSPRGGRQPTEMARDGHAALRRLRALRLINFALRASDCARLRAWATADDWPRCSER
jgi:hypothetical protein